MSSGHCFLSFSSNSNVLSVVSEKVRLTLYKRLSPVDSEKKKKKKKKKIGIFYSK